MSDAPSVSIIVPLAGGATQALRCFQGIAAQPEQPTSEVIVVDDASVGLDALLRTLDGDVRVIRSESRIGFVAAVLLGAEHARGDLVVIVRDGATPASGWLAPLAAAFDDSSVGLAASTTSGEIVASPVAAWSAAVRVSDLRAAEIGNVPAPLAFAALALSVAQRGLQATTIAASTITAPGSRTGGSRRPVGELPELTVVIPTLDASSDRVRACVAAVQATTDAAHQIVIIDNGCPPQGFSSPVNCGLRAARTPYVVVMNDDVEPLAGWWAPLRAALDSGASVVFPLTVDGAMRYDFAAWCFAMSRASVDELGHGPGEFFDPTLVVWYQDTDLLYRLRGLGRPPVLVDQSRIHHGLSETVDSEDPQLRAWITAQVAADRERFLAKHAAAALRGTAPRHDELRAQAPVAIPSSALGARR